MLAARFELTMGCAVILLLLAPPNPPNRTVPSTPSREVNLLLMGDWR